jgi:hypothetical protein
MPLPLPDEYGGGMTPEAEEGAVTARTRYRRGEGARLRDDILEAASRLFFEQQPHGYGPEEVKASAAFGHLMANVAAFQADPRIRDDIDVYEVALDCWAYVHGLTSLLISKPDFGWPDPEVLLDGHFDRLLMGLMRRS